jgi:putative transposase
MPRRPRFSTGGIAYHVLNRRVGRLSLFETPTDYSAFEQILHEAHKWTGSRIAAYCLMPNHWHLLLWPRNDGELSEIMRWITVTHTQRWHAHRGTSGSGPVYQGRFKSFPVETDEHFITVVRYVERNALRAKLVKRAEEWHWSSLWRMAQKNPKSSEFLCEWPVPRPQHWIEFVNQAEKAEELEQLRSSAQRGRPFGSEAWVVQVAKQLGLESTLNPRGRPKRKMLPTPFLQSTSAFDHIQMDSPANSGAVDRPSEVLRLIKGRQRG